jgi:hypothetical protein
MLVTPSKRMIAVLLTAALLPLLDVPNAPAQAPRRNRRLAALQQQNAFVQQQNAVQMALQHTTALLQVASQQTSVSQSGAAMGLISFQQQQSALEIALQQTSNLLQVGYQHNFALAETALRQSSTLQTALQQTINLQGSVLTQNGQLTPRQLQTLSQERSSLTGLLIAQPPPQSGRRSSR